MITGLNCDSYFTWEKGINHTAFFRGEVDKFSWSDIGTSFLPSEIVSAFVWAQLENLDDIQNSRKILWHWYNQNAGTILKGCSFIEQFIQDFATINSHMFYVVCKDLNERYRLLDELKRKGILGIFHYQSLHKSHFTDPATMDRNWINLTGIRTVL